MTNFGISLGMQNLFTNEGINDKQIYFCLWPCDAPYQKVQWKMEFDIEYK